MATEGHTASATDSVTEAGYPENLLEGIIKQQYKDFLSMESKMLSHKDAPGDPNSVHVFYPPVFLGFWAALREGTLVEGIFDRKEKEIIAAFVSRSNECAFCSFAHEVAALSQGADKSELEKALADKDPHSLSDKRLGSILDWVLKAQKKDGAANSGKEVPLSGKEVPEVLAVVLTFNYINRVMDALVTKDKVLPAIPFVMRVMLKVFKPIMGVFSKKAQSAFGEMKHKRTPGDSSDLMHLSATLPEDLAWAELSDPIAKALSYWVWAMDKMADIYIPQKVAKFVGNYIDKEYTGEAPGISRNWAFSATDELEGTQDEKLAASFMLLVAFSPYQVDNKLKQKLKKSYSDHHVRAFGIWAAFQTARNIAEWMGKACAE